jgi:predicted PurR-regulated permease PerM
MGDADSPRGWISRDRLLALSLGFVTLISLYVCYRIVRPFIPAIAIALAASVATRRFHSRLQRRLGSKTIAAMLSVLLVACLIVVPISLLIAYVVQQVVAGISQLQAGNGLADWLTALNVPQSVHDAIDWIESNLDLRAQLTRLGQNMAAKAGELLASSVGFLTQLVIMLFVLFFLYRDGDHALAALRNWAPLSNEEFDRIVGRVEDTILATVNGSLTVALVQATLAGTMYAILKVPAAAIWASATFFAALLPVFGTVLVWGPVAAYLLLSGSWMKAVILVAWGLLAVGTIDNILYPFLVGGRLRLHPVPTFFSIVGGISLFGPAGVILGPVSLAITIALLAIWGARTAVPGEQPLPAK